MKADGSIMCRKKLSSRKIVQTYSYQMSMSAYINLINNVLK